MLLSHVPVETCPFAVPSLLAQVDAHRLKKRGAHIEMHQNLACK